MSIIYFDNAATGGVKSKNVVSAVLSSLTSFQANAGRGSSSLAVSAAREVYETRKLLSKTFNNGHIDRVIFTANCTQALNFAIFGLWRGCGNIVADATNHNAVLRPLSALKTRGAEIRYAYPSDKKHITVSDVLPLIDKETSFVCINAVSNVTGEKNGFEEIGSMLRKLGVPLIVDGAQAGGHIPIDMNSSGINCLCLAGHKGLGATQGAGVLVFDESVEITPLLFGGSGTESFAPVPSSYPEKLEAGTLNLPAIKGLKKAIIDLSADFYRKRKRIYALTESLIKELESFPEIKLFSRPNECGIVSFLHENAPSERVEEALSENGIIVRSGYHCAPKTHEFLGTADGGLTRISLSEHNTERELYSFLSVLSKLKF